MSSQRTYKKLGDLVNIRTGKLDANAANEGGKYPFFTCSREPLQIDTYSYDCECVLIAGNGDLNVKYYKGKFDAYQRTYIVEKKPEIDYISTYYIYQFFQEYVKVLRARSIGGIIKYIKLGDLTEAMLPVPSLSEQQSIVRELDAISDVIAAKNAQLRELDALAQALFYSTFGDPATNPKGWPVKKLGEICKFLNGDRGVNYPSVKDFVSEGIPFINAGHLQNGKICFDDMNYITKEKYDLLHAGKIQKDDILFCLRGSLGKFALIDFEDNGAIASSLVIIRSLNEILPLYIMGYLLTSAVKEQIERANNGSSQPNLSAKSVADFRLPLPPLSLQQSFAAKIQAIEAQKTTLRQSIAEFESLLAQRMDYHFN